ncbi:MAG: hypothetical protein AAGC53_23435 [Actinomycetota bacterium]
MTTTYTLSNARLRNPEPAYRWRSRTQWIEICEVEIEQESGDVLSFVLPEKRRPNGHVVPATSVALDRGMPELRGQAVVWGAIGAAAASLIGGSAIVLGAATATWLTGWDAAEAKAQGRRLLASYVSDADAIRVKRGRLTKSSSDLRLA